MAPTDDLGLATFLAEGVTWEPETSNLLDLTLREGMTFVDVGANIGLHTLRGARAVGPSGVVFAFEPTPKVFQLLQRSVYLNGLGDICRCTNLALSTSEGVATLHLSDVCGHNSLYQLAEKEEKSQLTVKTASFDAVLQEAPRIDVVKLDVEGAELDVLDGMKHLLAKHWNILLIVEYGVPHLERLGIGPAEWFGRFFLLMVSRCLLSMNKPVLGGRSLKSKRPNWFRPTWCLSDPKPAYGESSSSMKPEPVVIVGSGGHAKVVIELVRAVGNYLIVGCTGLAEVGFVLSEVPILGTDTVLPALGPGPSGQRREKRFRGHRQQSTASTTLGTNLGIGLRLHQRGQPESGGISIRHARPRNRGHGRRGHQRLGSDWQWRDHQHQRQRGPRLPHRERCSYRSRQHVGGKC